MGSMNNWLGFSLAPHMTVDMNQTAGVGTSMSMIMSNFSESNVGYGGTDGFELPSNSSASLAMADMSSLRSGDGSLCLFEAMNRTHNAGGGGGEWQKCLSSQSEAVKTENNSNEQKRPKLEDLLGGAFVGGVQFSDDASTDINTSELDRIYGKAPVFDRDSDQNPSLKTAMVGDHMHMKGVASDVTVTDSSKGQTDHPALRSGPMHDLYNQNNDHDTSNEDAYNMFSDCSLQLSQSSMNNNNNNNMYGLSDFKTWLRSQSSDEQSKVIHDNCLPNSGATTEPTTNKESFALAIPASASIQAKSPAATNSNNEDTSSSESKKRSLEQAITPVNTTAKKSLDTFGQRTSIYRGVTRHRWTGRYEAHLWDNSCRRDGQTRKGRQVYLGGYDKEEKAARAYDLAALKYWGPSTTTNFPIANYEKELEEMKHMTRQEYVASLRRKSSGFSRGASIYRGVTRHHQHGRWQARIGRVAGNKDLYLGTFSTQEEAAEAYDIAAIKFRGLNAVTNFDMSRYDVKSIMNSALPIGGLAKRIKEAESAQLERTVDGSRLLHDEDSTLSSHTDNASYGTAASSKDWPLLAFQQQANPSLQTAYQQRGLWWKQISDQQATHQDFQLQLHPYAYHQKYLQPPNGTVLHNLMGLESAAINDVNNPTATGLYTDISNTLAANSLIMPNSSIPSANSSVASATDNSRAAHFSDNSEGSVASKTSTYENLYYLTQQQQQQQQSSGLGRVTYETSACNNWVAPSLQSLGSRPNLAVCHAPVFTVWSDT